MSEESPKSAEMAEFIKAMRTVTEEVRNMKSEKNKPQHQHRPYYGSPFPPTNSMGAFGPMMMAWMLSWLYANPRSKPSMLDQMAKFAASRESFWHHSMDMFAEMDRRSGRGAAALDQYCDPAISNEDKDKIKAALEAQKVDQRIIDCVFHAMNLVDFFKQYRGDPHKHYE